MAQESVINATNEASLAMVNLPLLMNKTSGSARIRIGMIDGPVNMNHPDLENSVIEDISGMNSRYFNSEGFMSDHGTFVAGILRARRGSQAPAICPQCRLSIYPIFYDEDVAKKSINKVTPDDLANAILKCIDANVKIINLSLSIQFEAKDEKLLKEVLDYATKKGIIIVAAAGNESKIKSTALIGHQGVIPVTATDKNGQHSNFSNIGNSIGKRGFGAPGEEIVSCSADGGMKVSGGTSFATPFVTGIIALLWSEFPSLSASEIKYALHPDQRQSIIPPTINAYKAWEYLNTRY